MDINLTEKYVEIIVQLRVYNLGVLHKCFYWYGDTFRVDIEVGNEDTARVKLFYKNGTLSENDYEQLIERISTDLIDFKTRDIITKETKNIRDLLVAKAFAHSDEFDSQPIGELSD